jgi:uncharacterized membrane protein
MFSLLQRITDSVRTSLWFIPLLMTALAVGVAQSLILLDQSQWLLYSSTVGKVSDRLGAQWIFGAGAEGARTLMATIASSMISIAATVFSITVVALSLAAGQLGPRLLRTFMRDRGTQLSLGVFIATFAYAIFVLGVIETGGRTAAPFTPKISVNFGVFLALVSLAVMIYFIHHVAKAIQAPEVIVVVGKELDDALSVRFPDPRQVADAADAVPYAKLVSQVPKESNYAPVPSAGSGYVQYIDTHSLTDIASEAGIVIRLDCRPGHHLIQGTRVASISPGSLVSDELCGRVNKAFTLGSVRTPAQDVLFLVNQLVEIAQRALSPGINDPVTATTCIDQLGSALGRVAVCAMPKPLQADKEGDLRLVFAQPDTFKLYLDTAFDPIRGLSRSSRQVSLCLTSLLGQLAQVVHSEEQKEALLAQAAMIQRGAQAIPEVLDRTAVEADCQRIIDALAPGHAN